MKSKDYMGNLREMTAEELLEKRAVLADEIFQLRYKSVTDQNDNTSAIKEKKKDLARLLTLCNGRALGLERQTGV